MDPHPSGPWYGKGTPYVGLFWGYGAVRWRLGAPAALCRDSAVFYQDYRNRVMGAGGCGTGPLPPPPPFETQHCGGSLGQGYQYRFIAPAAPCCDSAVFYRDYRDRELGAVGLDPLRSPFLRHGTVVGVWVVNVGAGSVLLQPCFVIQMCFIGTVTIGDCGMRTRGCGAGPPPPPLGHGTAIGVWVRIMG